MYHIPNDKRAKNSADLLSSALLDHLKVKAFDDISISDLSKKSTVSRSTFYRLFDNTLDLLIYTCDRMFEDIVYVFNKTDFENPVEMLEFFNKEMMSKDVLLDSLVKNHRLDILYSTHMKFADHLLPHFKVNNNKPTQKEDAFILHILAASMCSYIGLWVENGKKETPEELTSIIKNCFYTIASLA